MVIPSLVHFHVWLCVGVRQSNRHPCLMRAELPPTALILAAQAASHHTLTPTLPTLDLPLQAALAV